MRPIRSGEDVGEGHPVDKPILAAVQETWNTWEIHSLMLLSLFLQVLLFFTADMRRRKASLVPRTVLWLAYLSADAVAIFVLGHLAVRASQPGHQLMSFWAPFVLVHLGGQDTITAFSKQDNELWRRHLLSLLTQVAVAGYVVAKASWTDRLLTSAMVLMFLSGCIKYAERTWCLFVANPLRFRSFVMADHLPNTLNGLRAREENWATESKEYMEHKYDLMSKARREDSERDEMIMDIALFVDAPPNTEQSISAANMLPGCLEKLKSSRGAGLCSALYGAYEFVGAHLVNQYKILYTKHWVRRYLYIIYTRRISEFPEEFRRAGVLCVLGTLMCTPLLLYLLFLFIAAPVALVLFTVAEKGEGDQQLHTSQADIIVSYILFVGAITLDVCSVTMLFLSIYIPSASCSSSRQQWSEELGQYSMMKRHVVQDTTGLRSSVRQWIGRRLGKCGVDLVELTHTPLTGPIKEVILDKLLLHVTKEEWHVASSRGLLSVQNWMASHKDDRASTKIAKELEKTIRSIDDFPTSVLIWHLATGMCYYKSTDTDRDKEVSGQISNYIMYLVFKCGVMLTYNSKYLHDEAHIEIKRKLYPSEDVRDRFSKEYERDLTSGGEKAGFSKIFEANYAAATSMESCRPNDKAGLIHLQKLTHSVQAFKSPVLPRAYELAKRLISIKGEAGPWGLIAAVWSEMLYYVAPRCGGAFHYEHLSTGGEFVTHVLALMRQLGPFMPVPEHPVREGEPTNKLAWLISTYFLSYNIIKISQNQSTFDPLSILSGEGEPTDKVPEHPVGRRVALRRSLSLPLLPGDQTGPLH